MDTSNRSSAEKSLGLLDIQDLSLDLNAKSAHNVKEKPPPIPNKQRKTVNNAQVALTDKIDVNMFEETQDMENTVASIHLNESDLKELEDEFSFDEAEDDDENDANVTNKTNGSGNRKKSLGTNNTLVKRFDLLQTNNASGDDLLNESANILMVSNEFSKLHNKSDVTNSPFTLNYSSMDKLNEQMNDKNIQKSFNDPKDISLTSSYSSKPNSSKVLQYSITNNNNFNETSMINETIETVSNQSSIERINQLVMQSVERVKRTALNYNNDEFLNSLNCIKNIDIKDQMNLDDKNAKRFSINSIKTQCSKFNNDTISNMSGFSTPGRLNMINQTDQGQHGFITPRVEIGENDTTLNNDNDNEYTIDFANPNKLTELASIYFKPCPGTETTPNGVTENRPENEIFDRVSFVDAPCQDRQTSPEDSMFQSDMPLDDSIFKKSNDFQNKIPKSSNEGIFKQSCQLIDINSAPASNDSMFKESVNSDYLFKASTAPLGNDSIFGQMIPESDMSIFKPQSTMSFDQPDDSIFKPTNNQQFSSGDDEASVSFKSGTAFMNDLETIEAQNRKEFASNNLTVLSTGNDRTSEKWWNLSIQQTSKLEVSMMSNSFDKKVYGVDEYFNQKSEMPNYLVDKDKVNISDDNKKFGTEGLQQTPQAFIDRKQSRIEAPDENSGNDTSNLTFSTSNMNTLLSTGRPTSNNFSFTFNCSDSGEFIQRKTTINDINPSPFQITKMVKKQIEALSEKETPLKLNPSNLKTIGEELDRVSNRLAHKNTPKDVEFKVPEVPKLHTEITTAKKNNPETLIPQMDETISSINTTSNVTSEIKMPDGNNKLAKPYNSSQKQSNNSINHHNSKQKLTSGSLTSTPSKLKTNSTNKEKISYKGVDKSDINLTNTNSTISSSTSNSTNYLFNQDSFISSIPESRTNDTTLVGNHHNHFLANAKPNSKKTLIASGTTSTASLKSSRNAEIQTTPSFSQLKRNDSNYSNSAQLNTSTTVTTTLSSTTTADIQEKLIFSENINMEKNLMTRSSLSSSDLATSALANNIQLLLNNQNSLSSNRSSMLNNSNSSTTSSQLHPVMFLSLQQISNLMNEMSTNQKAHDSNLSNSSSVNQLTPTTNPAGQSTTQNNLLSTSIQSSANTSFNKFELPNIDLNKTEINFGQIAEGCRHTSRIFARITNHSILSNIPTASCLLAEFDEASEWTIESYNSDESKSSKYDDLKPRLASMMSLHLTKEFNNSSKSTLKLPMNTNYYEFFVHLDTKDLTYFKEMIYQQQLLKQHRNYETSDGDNSSIKPLAVSTHMSIYYCVGGDVSKKYLLNRICLKCILGYARIKTSSSFDSIEFEVFGEEFNSDITEKRFRTDCDVDKTLTSFNASLGSDGGSRTSKNLDKFIPLSNAGNIDIDVDCYFRSDENDSEIIRLLKIANFEIRIEEFVINIQANSKQKKCARLMLIKNGATASEAKIKSLNSMENYRFIIQVKPDGLLYEIPVRIKFAKIQNASPRLEMQINQEPNRPSVDQSIASKTTNITNTAKIKVATSNSILFFGKSLHSRNQNQTDGLSNDLTIKNLNDFLIRYNIVVYSLESEADTKSGRSVFSLFKFSAEMYKLAECCNRTDTGKMTRLIVDLKPQQEICLKLRFDSNVAESELAAGMLQNGVIKISAVGFIERFNVYLVGFLNNSQLEIDRVTKTKVDLKSLDSLRVQKQLQRQNITQTTYYLQINRPASGLNILKKSLRLENKSLNSQIIIYPICYLLKQNTEIVCQLSDSHQATSCNRYEKSCMIELVDGLTVRLRIVLSTQTAFSQCDQLVWFEIGQNEAITLNLEFELLGERDNGKLAELEKKLHQNFYMGIFWVESDLNVYCVEGIKQLEQNANSSTHADNIQKHEIALNGQAFRLENFLNKIISNTLLFSANHENILNASSVSCTSMSELSKTKHSCDTSSVFNTSALFNRTKAKIKRNDYYKLLCQSIKCSLVNVSTLGIDHSIDDSFDVSNMSAHNDNSSHDAINMVTPKAYNQDPWSCDTELILFHNLKIDTNLQSISQRLVLSNNVGRKVTLELTYRQSYLDVSPNIVVLKPFEKHEVRITPKREVFNRLPWNGVIGIKSQRFSREVKITLLSTSDGKSSQLGLPSCRKSISSSNISALQSYNFNINNSVMSSTSSSSKKLQLNHPASTPICAKSALSLPTPSSNCTSLEQGTLVSEITQNTLDSLSLTPLISASFISFASTNSSRHTNNTHDLFSLHKARQSIPKSSNQNNSTTSVTHDSSIIKILHFGKYAQILFPPVAVRSRSSYDLTLINPTKTSVNWRAFSRESPFLRGNSEQDSVNLSAPEYENIFKLTPHSGVIPVGQKQTIKIEFSPVEAFGVFTQHWEIDTNTDQKTDKSNSLFYNCKLVLSGRSVSENNEFICEEASDLRLNSRILKAKQNALNVQNKTANMENFLDGSLSNKSNVSKMSDKSIKENTYSSSVMPGSSSFSGSLLSASTTSSASTFSTKAVIIKDDQIVFADITPGSMDRQFILIHNREERTRELVIMSLMEPFKCKYPKVKVHQKHYLKLPIEFKPRVKGEYLDSLLIRVEGYENPLTCLLKGKCV